MTKRIIAVVLAFMILCTAAASAEGLIARAISIIGSQESGNDYGCAETDVNGKASLGFMQWNGSRAAALLRAIIALDADTAADILGSALYSRLKDATGCVLSSSERAKVRELLLTPAGKTVQDKKAVTDVTAYVNTARKLGIVDLNALCYYCDLVHQVGTGAVVKYHVLASQLAGGYANITLEHIYKAALNFATHTKARRTRVYNMLLKNPVDGSQQDDTDGASLSIDGDENVEITRGEKLKLTYTLENSTCAVFWKSSAPGIARVNKNGVVRGVKKGRAVITAYTATGLKDKVTVRVRKP